MQVSTTPLCCILALLTIRYAHVTRETQVLRATMRAMADGTEYKVPATIDDPTVLDEVAAVILADRSGH